MEIGVHLPHVGPMADRESVTGYAQAAEEYGFDSLWVSDHVVVPRNLSSRYPYRADGEFPVQPDTPMLDPIATLLFVAGVTQRAKLGTTVLVLPMRNPIITAKMLASLDVLSGGRLILGAGAGWMREEFDLLGMPFERRGARTDDYIQLFKALWTEDNPSFHGKLLQVEDVGFAPKPLQRPHPPIWVGGHSKPALRRAGRLGDAWHAAFVGPEGLREEYQQVRRYAEEAGRDPDSVALTVRTRLPLNDVAKAVEHIERLREVGVSHIVAEIFTLELEKARELMGVLAKEIRPKAGV